LKKYGLEIFIDGEQIILQKYKSVMQCQITGKVSDNNISLAAGRMTPSPEEDYIALFDEM
jgi:transcriptional pleiotropic regulator of transition state genes